MQCLLKYNYGFTLTSHNGMIKQSPTLENVRKKVKELIIRKCNNGVDILITVEDMSKLSVYGV